MPAAQALPSSPRKRGEVKYAALFGLADARHQHHGRHGSFVFHPAQVLEDQPDGSLIVRFKAAGHLEMCWHLYTWGDKVEVLAPKSLRKMVHPYRRSDFPALP